MELPDLLPWRLRVEKLLATHFTAVKKEARARHPNLLPFVEATEEFTLRGGKRFRACLLLAGYHLGGGKDLRVALPAAAALETFQSWMLIHDDVMDHGERRRGGPTLHVKLASWHSEQHWNGSDADFGEGMAITLGDLLEPWTLRLFLSCRVSDARKLALLQEYRAMSEATASGQVLDVLNGVKEVEQVQEKDVLTVHRLKSAVYTVSSPLRMGATLAGASAASVRALGEIGDNLGIAFQLRDDVLGAREVAGSDAGKSANDLYEGKRTLLVVRAWQKAGRDGRAALARVLGNPLATDQEFDAAISVLEETGSFQYSEDRIRTLVAGAERRIASSRWNVADRRLLSQIGAMLTQRAV